MQKTLAYISTRGRYDTTLANAMLSVALQSRKPDKFILFDDNDSPRDIRAISIYEHILKLFDERGIKWEVLYGKRMGQHHNHQTANKMGFDFCWRLDDDEFAEQNVLETLMSNMTDDVGAVGCTVTVPMMAMGEPPEGTDNSIEQFMKYPNLQWFRIKGKREVDHLYSSFLYRAGIVDYNTNLSRVAHTEETQFTYELKRKGYKVILDPSAFTWHFREPKGGIRDGQGLENWKHDEYLFQTKLKEWGLINDLPKLVVLNNGIGDHIVFKKVLPKLKEKYGKVLIACCYHFVFDGEDVISIEQAKEMVDIEHYDLYKWMWDHNWKTSVESAYEAFYL